MFLAELQFFMMQVLAEMAATICFRGQIVPSSCVWRCGNLERPDGQCEIHCLQSKRPRTHIAEVATAIANGDLSRKITVEVKDEILELKDTISTMIDQPPRLRR